MPVRLRPPHGSRAAIGIVIAHAVLIQVITFALRPGLAYAVLDSSDVAALLGVLSAGFAIPALLLALPSGQFVDRLGERVAAILGSVLVVAAAVVALLSRGSFVMVLLATVLLGCGHLLSVVSEQTLVANQAQSGRMDATFGRYTLAASAGQVLGPLLLAIPGDNPATPPLTILFAVCVGLGLLLGLTSVLIQRTPSAGSPAPSGILSSAGSLLSTKGVPRALLASSIALSTVDITLLYWPALGQERGLEVAVISAMLFTRSVCTMASRGALGFVSKFAGRKALMGGSLFAAALALAAGALPLESVGLVVAAGLFGFCIGLCQPLTMSWLTELSPPGQRGMTLSLRLAGNRIGQSAIPSGVGALAAATGPAGVLVISGVALIGAGWAGLAIRNADAG